MMGVIGGTFEVSFEHSEKHDSTAEGHLVDRKLKSIRVSLQVFSIGALHVI